MTAEIKFIRTRLAREVVIGEKYKRLTILSFVGNVESDKGNRSLKFLFRCDCGKEVVVAKSNIGKQISCGCIKVLEPGSKTHGLTVARKKHGLYTSYCGMLQRCHNPNNAKYPIYGGRGISVEEPWRSSIQSFIDDMMPSWSKDMSIERKDLDGNYCKSNCEWIPMPKQAINRGTTIWIEHNGRKEYVRTWAKELGIPETSLVVRWHKGWPVEACFFKGSLKSKKGVALFRSQYPEISLDFLEPGFSPKRQSVESLPQA